MGKEDAEHPKRAPMGTFWVFGVRGGTRACWVGCVCVGRMGHKRILHILGLCGAESGKDVLQELVGGFMLTFHLIHGGFYSDDVVHVNWPVVNLIRG